MSEIYRRRPRPDGTNLSFHLSGMIAEHRRNLGLVGKLETLPILQICPRPFQTIGDIDDFEFSLFGKIWDSREFFSPSRAVLSVILRDEYIHLLWE